MNYVGKVRALKSNNNNTAFRFRRRGASVENNNYILIP